MTYSLYAVGEVDHIFLGKFDTPEEAAEEVKRRETIFDKNEDDPEAWISGLDAELYDDSVDPNISQPMFLEEDYTWISF